MFSCKFCEISKNAFIKEHLWATASVKDFSVNVTKTSLFVQYEWLIVESLFWLPKKLIILNKYIQQRVTVLAKMVRKYFVEKVNTPCAFHVLALYFSCTVYSGKRWMENN